MATVYGNTVNSRWCAYMNYWTSETATTITLTAECCLQVNNYSVSYNNVTGDVSIDFSVNNSAKKSINKSYGAGTTYYSFCSASKTFTKTKSAQSKAFSAGVTFGAGSGYWPGTSRAYANLTVPAIASYTVSYNANGGTGAPGAQTKWYGENLTLSSTKPTRTGYTFLRWSTTFSSGTVTFNPGGTYSYNSGATLYAVWQANTYSIKFNANGGSGAPGAQTKTYGQTLYLSSTRPTRTNYNFKGWATSASATTAQYQPGGAFTTNAATTLYAVWELAYVKPRITNLNADRCTSDGTLSEEGQYAKVTFNWATDKTVSSIKIVCNGVTSSASGSGTSGSVSIVVGANALSTENQYEIEVTVADASGSTMVPTTIAPMTYIMDFEPGGSVAFGGPASPASNNKAIRFYNGIVNHEPPMVTTARATEGYGSAGYNKVLTFTNAGNYANSSIEITLVQRARHICKISLYMANSNSTNLTVGSAVGISYSNAFGGSSVFYRNPSANVLEIWVHKTEAYDLTSVANVYYDRFYMAGLTYSTIQDYSSSLPSGATAIGVRSLLGVPYATQGSYYGMTLPDGSSTNWMRTTYNGLIPYAASTDSPSALGTSTWCFGYAWINELNWNGSGLRGQVMKQIWSGTWNAGSITVSGLSKYNLIVFTTLSNNQHHGIGMRVPGSNYWSLFNVNARTDDGLVFNSIIATQSGSTLTMNKNAHAIWRTSTSSVANSQDGTIYKIYGVL